MGTTLYQSLPIVAGSKQIRVLHVYSALRDEETIDGDLKLVDLAKPSSFAALSYVWGEPSPLEHFITCNSVKVQITKSCYLALIHLRKKLGQFAIWIDAICMDQQNSDEKAHQIPLMGDIYSNADVVYLWLGEGSYKTDRAMAYLATAGFQHYCRDKKENLIAPSLRPFLAACSAYFAGWSLTRHPLPFPDDEEPFVSWRSFSWIRRFSTPVYCTESDLKELLSREWIRRLWTYQEILLASNPTIICGDSILHWSTFELSMIFLRIATFPQLNQIAHQWRNVALSRERLLQVGSSHTKPSPASRLEAYEMFISQLSRHWTRSKKMNMIFYTIISLELVAAGTIQALDYPRAVWSMPAITCALFLVVYLGTSRLRNYVTLVAPTDIKPDELLEGLYYRKATDPKDMAFGLWAALQRRAKRSLPAPHPSESVGSIYRSFSATLVSVTGSLHILFVAAARKIPAEPSWVPDWSGAEQHEWGDLSHVTDQRYVETDSFVERSYQGFASDQIRGKSHNADAPFYRFNQDRTVLTIRALRLRIITLCFRFHSTDAEYRTAEHEVHKENLATMMQLHSAIGKANGSVISALKGFESVAQIFDRMNLERRNEWTKFCYGNRKDDPSTVLCRLQNPALFVTPGSRLLDQMLRSVPISLPDIFRIQITICNLLAREKKMLFKAVHSQNNKYTSIGYASQGAQVGNEVIKILGVPIPLVVSSSTDTKMKNHVQIISPALMQRDWEDYGNTLGLSWWNQEVEYFSIV